MDQLGAHERLAYETTRARRSLRLERLFAVCLWPLVGFAAWIALWMVGAPLALPTPVQTALAAAAAFSLLALVFLSWRAWSSPRTNEARARLADDAGVDGDTFAPLFDAPSRLDPASAAFWRLALGRAEAAALVARARPARLQLARRDPLRLRWIALAGLAGAAIFAGPDAAERALRAFAPDPAPLVGDGPMAIEAWLTPAAYTRAAPVSLSERIGQRVTSAPSVTATVRVTGPQDAPVLVFNGADGRERRALFRASADGAYEARLSLPGAGRLRIVRFFTRASWRVAPDPDARPRAEFAQAPVQGERETVRFDWRASDDFGVARLALRATPVNPPPGLRNAAPIDAPIETPPGDPNEAEGSASVDLAEHPYAGMEVDLRVVAFDALGQAGESQAVRMVLPERLFLQRLARAAIEIRRMVMWEQRPYRTRGWFGLGAGPAMRAAPDRDLLLGVSRIFIEADNWADRIARAPEGLRRAASYLDALMMTPQDGYFQDRAVFFGLALARANTLNARDNEEAQRAARTLWRTALRAEYGGAGNARRALEAAQQALAQALREGAPEERVRQLLQAMREATARYMQALVEEAIRNGEDPAQNDDTEEQTVLTEQDIARMLAEVEQLAQSGRTQEANDRLANLADILNNLDVELQESAERSEGQGNQDGQSAEETMAQTIEELSAAIGEQRALNDDTARQQDAPGNQGAGEDGQGQGGQGQNGQGAGGQGLAERQGALRGELSRLRAEAGAAGQAGAPALSAAEDAMARAENALRRGDFEGARAAQDQALAGLRRGANTLAEDMRRTGQSGPAGTDNGGARDPLGRAVGGAGAGEGDQSVIPTQSERVRAREILDDIRRRAQDPNRPEAERDYLRRLLDRFGGSSS